MTAAQQLHMGELPERIRLYTFAVGGHVRDQVRRQRCIDQMLSDPAVDDRAIVHPGYLQ